MSSIINTLKRNKKTLIIMLVVWIILVIIFAFPISASYIEARKNNTIDLAQFLSAISNNITNPISSIQKIIEAKNGMEVFKSVLGTLTLIYLVAGGIGIYKARKNGEYHDIEHGSSDWCENGEEYKILSNKKGIILAEKHYLPLTKMGNLNVLIVGGSGSGKSASYVIPNAYQMLGSYIFTDPKGELFDKTAGFLKANGYEIKVLNLVTPNKSDGYNPLMHINSEIDVDVIANTIVRGQKSDGGNSSDPFWDNMAEILLKALIFYLLSMAPPEEQNLASCAELVRAAANSDDGENILGNLMDRLPLDHPARTNFKSIAIATGKTYDSILSSLQSKLGKFDSREIAELTSTDTIDFEEIGKKKTALYVISSDTHGAYDFLLTIFFAQMIQQLYDYADKNGGALQQPTYFILDEFANIGKIPDFDKKISTSRSRKINFSVILQNLDQLEAVYKDAYETIIGNCDTHVFLGSNSQKTVEYFSKALGEKTIKRESVSVNRDNKQQKQGTSESDQIMGRALLTPDELRRFDNDYCIIYEKGIKPVKAHKYYYFKYPTAKYASQYPMSHVDMETPERGEWRKYNPNNPYGNTESNENLTTGLEDFDLSMFEDNKEEDSKTEKSEMDIQKELEDKFDALFGNLEDEDDNDLGFEFDTDTNNEDDEFES